MQKTLLILAASLFFGLAGCKPKNASADSNPANNTASTAAAALAKLNFVKKAYKAEKSGQTCELTTEIAQGDSPQAKFINKFIFKILGGGEMAEKGDFNYQKVADDFVNMAAEMQEEDPTGDWSKDASVRIGYNNGNFLCLYHSGWEYAGGAHGEGWGQPYFLDMVALKELKNSDLIADELGLRKLISPLLEKQIAATVAKDEYSDTDYFKEDGIYRLCSDWRIDEKGTVFFSYSYSELFDAGEWNSMSVEVELPLAKVQPFLKLKL